VTEAQLTHFLHRYGINIRFLGLVCSYLRESENLAKLTTTTTTTTFATESSNNNNNNNNNNPFHYSSSHTLALCLTEVWARVLKNVTRARWREKTRHSCVLQQCVRACVQLANHVITRNRRVLSRLVEEAVRSFPFLFCADEVARADAMARDLVCAESEELRLSRSRSWTGQTNSNGKSSSKSTTTPKDNHTTSDVPNGSESGANSVDESYLSSGLASLISHLDEHCDSVLRRYACLCGFKFSCLDGAEAEIGR
jgi:hypothetical protein